MKLQIETKKIEVCKSGTGSVFYAWHIMINDKLFRTFYDEESLNEFLKGQPIKNVSKRKPVRELLWTILDCILYTWRK